MRRYLVVANQTLCGQPLVDKVGELMATGPCEFHLVVPATHGHHHLTWTEGEASALARGRLDQALSRLKAMGAVVDGEVGDARAIDAGRRRHPSGPAVRRHHPVDTPARPLAVGQDLPHRLDRTYHLPVIHIVGEAVVFA